MIPERLPVLSGGKQEPGSGKVCAEQAVNWLVSGRLDLGTETDHPACVQPVLNALAIKVNDLLPDQERYKMWPVILRQPGTARPEMEPVLSVRLLCWCARQVLHLSPLPEQSRACIEAAEAWCECPCTRHADAASYAAADASYLVAYADAAASYAAADAAASYAADDAAASASYADAAASYASYAADAAYAAYAADAAYAAASYALLGLLEGAQAECERLTGHIPNTPDIARLERLGQLVGVTQ